MKTFISFFDLLGFKEFILSDDDNYCNEVFYQILLTAQQCVCHGKSEFTANGFVPDFEQADINFMHVSDSLIFWTNTVCKDSFLRLLDVSSRFMWETMFYDFPIRGSINFGEIMYEPLSLENKNKYIFNSHSMYGKGLTNAYLKAESQNWAGCVIDHTAIKQFKNCFDDVNEFALELIRLINEEKIIKYQVPYKRNTVIVKEYVVGLSRELEGERISDVYEAIHNIFSKKRKILSKDAELKFKNTMEFIATSKYFINPDLQKTEGNRYSIKDGRPDW